MLLPFLLLWGLAIPGGHAFFPNFWSKFLSFTWGSFTHQDLTEEAVLNVTLQILLDNKHPTRPPLHWEDFEGKTLTADAILEAYYGDKVSLRPFRAAMREIVGANANMDFLSGTRNDPVRHFDSERVRQGNSLLLRSREDLLRSIGAKEYEGAREILGQILHSLQDFYSHTNWVELGNTDIHPNLTTPGKDIDAIAEVSVQTCTDCADVSCQNNIASTIQKRHLLTSGYYGVSPVKPQGKCSHGGPFDDSRERSARGGINKDTANAIFSPHHFLHEKAARLALKASIKFLNELRPEVTDRGMLRLLGVSAFPALSFVLDTTGSMGEEITSARLQTHSIIRRQLRTLLAPDYYILVPFNDPSFGPVYKTSDPEEFLNIFNSLHAVGGGDEPEMCLSALQLALVNTPPHSEIFVFTDASAKDTHLRSNIEALIQERKMKVSFLITEDTSRTKARSRREVLHPNRFDLYAELSSVSGGQIIFTNNQDISEVAKIITDSAYLDVVTLLNVQMSEGGINHHVFLVDEFLHNVTMYINGDVRELRIHDPTGRKQNGRRQFYGKFTRVFLSDPLQVGNWTIFMKTVEPYSIHVQGRSSVDFLYYFGTPVNGSHPGLYQLNHQPVAGVPVILVVDAIGLPESANLSHVSLTTRTGKIQTAELETANQAGLFTAKIGEIPIGEFSVGVRGQGGKGLELKREAPQHLTAAECILEMSSNSLVTPGTFHTISVKITNFGKPHCYSLKMSDDVSEESATSWLQMDSGKTEIWNTGIKVPDSTEQNTIVAVMVEALLCDSDIQPPCFTYLPLIVIGKNETSTAPPPVCPQPSYLQSCPESLAPGRCKDHQWSAMVLVTDINGIKSAHVVNGSGTASPYSDAGNDGIEYTSSCCHLQAELLFTNHKDAAWNCSLHAPIVATQAGPKAHYLLIIPLLLILVVGLAICYVQKKRRSRTDTEYSSPKDCEKE
ncbi:von Willebrand factor A domain-containing protein 7 [Hyla sarda]|uniref:von Willebrand factor A domain-containing protein 7 n=1 Tax=Hyla sarda TaxID=327740 RepID=UPI0024C23719|nr:von Willebrand factor A domain-containing protein 7 [Hyla sarda]XP_056396773.1 von Willebrand factor A domain-containing protein 7 [Hyla sarda]